MAWLPLEIVIFSPRRASRKLLGALWSLSGCWAAGRIVEFNQEQCRVNAYDSNSSLIRSFPSKVGVVKHSNPRSCTLHPLTSASTDRESK